MLQRLTIKNVALIDCADIRFHEGLNVLSGETGAGKSVILDSVNFVLGAKADRSMIRYGETECLVKAEFLLPETSQAVQILREMDIDSDGEIIISRKFSENGKNSIKVNGNTVTATMLRQVTDSLVDVHGQSEHFFLLNESNQLKTLDSGIADIIPLKEKVSLLLKEKKRLQEQISLLGGDEKDRSRRLDILLFQIEEIENANLQEGEEDTLIEKRNKIHNLEKILSALQTAVSALREENGVADGLRISARAISSVSGISEEYAEICDKIDGVSMEVEDIISTLSDMGESLYFDENEANETEARLDEIRALKRKYGANKGEIDGYLQTIREEYDLLSNCAEKYEQLTAEIGDLDKKIYDICLKMSYLRKEYGKDFCRRVTDELKTLNIPNAQFDIQFNEYTETDLSRVNSNGLDEICFFFSANAGEPMKSLGKIISGGEMSRFMLAIKTQLSDLNGISTYIFDEIDAGISGKTAKVVGEKLARIAKNRQIIAVSHLAQIAVMSDSEYLIEKSEFDGKTHTTVLELDENQKKSEIVRLLGGTEKDEYALKHAEELMKQAKEYKNSIN